MIPEEMRRSRTLDVRKEAVGGFWRNDGPFEKAERPPGPSVEGNRHENLDNMVPGFLGRGANFWCGGFWCPDGPDPPRNSLLRNLGKMSGKVVAGVDASGG